jgi:hypothetical protein
MSKKGNIKNEKSIQPPPNLTNERKNFPHNFKKEYNFKIVALLGFVISFILLAFSYTFWGSYFEMNDDPRYVMAMKGFATPLPYDNFVSVYIFTVNLYIWLYKHFPNIGWYGYSMFLLLWGTLFNLFISLYLISIKRTNLLLIVLLFLAFYFLIFFQNSYWINFTRPAILATSSFIILLAILYLDANTVNKNKWILIFPCLTYILGHLTRLDAGYLGFVFGSAFATLIILNQKKIFPFFSKFILPVVLFIVLIKIIDLASQKSNTRNNEFLKKTEIIRQLIDYRNAAAFIPKTIKDTIAYNAMINARYCSDEKIISVDFLKQLTDESPLLERGNEKKFNDEFGAFSKSLDEENYVAKNLNYGCFILVLLWLITSFKTNFISFLKYTAFQLFFISATLFMSYFMKMPARIFNPLLVILTISNILFLFSLLIFKEKKFYYSIGILFFATLYSIPKYTKANKNLITNYSSYGKVNQIMIDDINNRFSNTIFIPTNLRSWEMHNATDPINEINFANKNSYVYLTIELSLAPETQDQLLSKFGTTDHAFLFNNISKMNNVVFISDDNFNNFLRAYYHYLYKQNYFFEKISNDMLPFYTATGLNYYRLKKAQ